MKGVAIRLAQDPKEKAIVSERTGRCRFQCLGKFLHRHFFSHDRNVLVLADPTGFVFIRVCRVFLPIDSMCFGIFFGDGRIGTTKRAQFLKTTVPSMIPVVVVLS